ncbi:MAG TPA: serine hydrolase domain-containing protein [Gammaproteobacteria bacterium]|nr:serine hydrolase domain-containing protein [Gammaproteobacteria bacterium]
MSIASRRAPAFCGVAALFMAAGWTSAALGGSIPTGKPEDVGMSSERLARIGPAMQKHVDAGEIAGVVTLVARRGRIVHLEAHGYSDIAKRTPMRTDAIFGLASSSKPITAVAIMMLVESGDVRLSDPVGRFIPEFAAPAQVAVARPGGPDGAFDLVPATRPITVGDLLKHGSGLLSGGLASRAAGPTTQRAPQDTLATYIPKLGAVPLDFQPGTLWRYSGLAGFDVLSRIVEVASQQPYDVFLRERIFEPLDMPDTSFYYTGRQAERLASVHARRDGKLEATPRDLSQVVYFSGASALSATVEDYLQFAQMLLNGGELNGHRLLGPRTVEMMTANHTGDMVNGQFGRPAAGMGFGLGMQVVLDPIAANLAVSKGAISWPGGSGVAHWIEPAEELVSIYFIQGGQGGPARQAFENAVRQAIID